MTQTQQRPNDSAASALAGSVPRVFWLDDPSAPDLLAPLQGHTGCDLVVVGGGYAGLWAALRAKERQPSTDVVLLEAGRCGDQASGRNGGFCAASLTHGWHNGEARWPDEMSTLERLGAQNLTDLVASLDRYGIDCDLERTGELHVATRPWQVGELRELAGGLESSGHDVELLAEREVRAQVSSPTYLAGLWDKGGSVLVQPARLAWGLRRACLDLGVRIYEQSLVTSVTPAGEGVQARTAGGVVTGRQAVLSTNAFRPLLRRLRLATVPVYDYVLVTEPLSEQQLAAVGWRNRQGIGDAGNLFHYYRLTSDNRILWGGYDAIYHFRSRVDRALEDREATYTQLVQHFFETFPQLAGITFTHRWAGVIDTSTRFCASYGTAMGGRVGYATGYTGLGVAATRFAADVVLDLLAGEDTERTRLRMVRERSLPFPPEPLRWLGIQATRASLRSADRRGGRRNVWLRALDRVGLGFDS